MIAWSWSRLSTYEQCPRKFKALYITKEITEPKSEQMTWGTRVHEALEKRLRDGDALTDGLEGLEPFCANLCAEQSSGRAALFAEKQLAFDRALKLCDWFDKQVWVRGIFDVVLISAPAGEKALLLDWKTGKRKDDHEQLKLFALLAMAALPSLQSVTTGYVWTQAQAIDTKSFTRDADYANLVNEFTDRYQAIEKSVETDVWPCKPSGLCRGWCPVTSCSYWKPKR